MIKPNEGKTDRAVRIVIGILSLIAAYYFLEGTFQKIAYFVGVAGLVTGAVGFCGLYTILGINTCPMKKSDKSKK